MERKEFEFKISDRRLQAYSYDCPEPKAVVILIHGMGEYARRYERSVIPALHQASIRVLCFDQFGHGRSSGKRGAHPGFEILLDCVNHVITLESSQNSDLPVILYGHSMGGNVAANYALRRPGKIDGLILTSPFLRLSFKPPALKLALGKILWKIAPSVTMSNELDASAISRDPAEVNAYENDPGIHDRVSPSYSIELIQTGEWAIEHAPDLRVRTLVMHGSGDRITSHEASKEFVRAAGNLATYIEVPEGYHELHHDLDREKTMNNIIQWIQDKQ